MVGVGSLLPVDLFKLSLRVFSLSVNEVECVSEESGIEAVVAVLLRVFGLSLVVQLLKLLLLLQACQVVCCLKLVVLVVPGENIVYKCFYKVPLSYSLRGRSL